MERTATLSETVLDRIGVNASLCTQCVKCTSGCPLAEEFDLTPNQVMRSVELDDARVLESRTIWLCASCHTCATRCPQEIDVTGVMDVLRIEARRRGVPPAVPEVATFDALFMRGVKMLGRNYELGFVAAYNTALGRPLRDAGLGARMLRRGKLKLLPKIVRGGDRKRKVAARTNAVAYYPGCSMDSSASEYGRSVRAVAEALGIELVEPEDWACCGSSAAHRLDPVLANVLPMRTVAAVEGMGLDTVTSPCSMCFARLKAAEHAVRHDERAATEVASQLGYDYRGTVEVRHLVEVIVERAGLAEVRERVRKPLGGLTVACYYGCLITRPPRITGAEDAEYPVKMDRLVEALGARTVEWSHKTECCGGSLSVTRTPLALKLSRRVIENAVASGAEAVVTMCPMCHINLDARQREMGLEKEIPIFQATQLMALAFGLDPKACLDRNLVDPRPLLGEKGMLS
jgi:heterodisulfide reductase subunit B